MRWCISRDRSRYRRQDVRAVATASLGPRLERTALGFSAGTPRNHGISTDRSADVLSKVQSDIGSGEDAAAALARLMDWSEARQVS